MASTTDAVDVRDRLRKLTHCVDAVNTLYQKYIISGAEKYVYELTEEWVSSGCKVSESALCAGLLSSGKLKQDCKAYITVREDLKREIDELKSLKADQDIIQRSLKVLTEKVVTTSVDTLRKLHSVFQHVDSQAARRLLLTHREYWIFFERDVTNERFLDFVWDEINGPTS